MSDHDVATVVGQLDKLARSDRISRRQLLIRATALGLSAPTIAVLLAACGGGSSAPTATTSSSSTTATKAPTVITGGGSAATPAGSLGSPTAGTGTGTGSAATPAANLKPPGKNQTFIYAQANAFRTLDPASATESGSTEVTHYCYDGLVASVPRSADIQPRLAKSWEITEGAHVITFHLQQGAKFHDGTLVDANAVKFSFQRTLQLNLGPAAIISGIDTIDTPDQFTVKFTLKQPNAYFVEGTTQIGIMSPTTIQKNDKGGDMGSAWLEAGHDAGSGPYMLTDYQKNVTGTAELFPDYWRGKDKPHITKIVWPIVPDATTRQQMLEKGDAHYVRSIPLTAIPSFASNPNIKVEYIRPFYDLWTMPMVTKKPPLDNPKVRQAIQYAFDYSGYLNQVWLGHGVIANGPTPVGLAGYTQDSPPFKQDVNKAKQLLAEAGASNISLQEFHIDSSAEENQSAVLLQDNLKQIGVDLKIQAMPWATMFKLVSSVDTAPHFTNLQIGPTWPDPAFTMDWTYGSDNSGKPYNWSYYTNPQVDDLIAKARSSTDRDQGRGFLEQANRMIIADAPTLWYINPDRVDTVSSKVQNWAPLVIGYPGEIDYYEIYLSD